MAGDHPEMPQAFLGKPYKRNVVVYDNRLILLGFTVS
jgi:hypothetical protein